MSNHLKIVIAEPSAILRCGLETILKKLSGFHLNLTEVMSADLLVETLRAVNPDILIINPAVPGYFALEHIKEEAGCPDMKCVAFVYSVADQALLRLYDEQFSIYDSSDEIKHKLELLNKINGGENGDNEEQQTLSSREKEIVVCVVKGMTNREIADRLFLSTHTVITHRRNIARKLQIHSASGLTVYAIVNKLVELSDIKTS